MSLLDCPYDSETCLWVIRSAWLPTTCQRCRERPVAALVDLGDHEHLSFAMTRYVCNECAKHYIKLPKNGGDL